MNTTPMASESVFTKKFRTYLLFGPPGSGKGTQGKALGALHGFFHCACGDVFRAIVPESAFGKESRDYLAKGEFVPDELTIQLWLEHISRCVGADRFVPDRDTLILDGIPRTVPQAMLLNGIIDVKKIFNLQCDDRSRLIERLKKRSLLEKRHDDVHEDVIQRRLDLFEHQSSLLLDHYSHVEVCHVNAMKTREEVMHQISENIMSEETHKNHTRLIRASP